MYILLAVLKYWHQLIFIYQYQFNVDIISLTLTSFGLTSVHWMTGL